MAKQVQLDDNQNVRRSILEFDSAQGEELFLLYSLGRENGPGIERDGRGSPWMSHPNPKWSHVHVTDPDLQRWGTWFWDKASKAQDLSKLDKKISSVVNEAGQAPSAQMKDYIDQLADLRNKNAGESTYLEQFRKIYPGWDVVAVQGIGDLTMNHWNVGYLRSPFTNKRAEILHLLDEPIHDRIYTCLVKWIDRMPKYQIRNVRFNRFVFNTDRNDPMVVQIDGEGVADKIEFAVYGQQLVTPRQDGIGGVVFDPSDIVHQFSDVRHLLQLPNLNPAVGRPRYFFGKPQQDDVWLGEAELLDDRNLRRAALVGPIELNRLYQGLGVSIDQVRDAMKTATPYSEAQTLSGKKLHYDDIPISLAAKGTPSVAEWRVVKENDALIDVRIRENRYPCTMIGVNDLGGLYFFAWKGAYSNWPGLTLRQAANELVLKGVVSAILCDEGADVFQYFDQGAGLHPPVISPGRGQMRALFVVARPSRPSEKEERAGEGK